MARMIPNENSWVGWSAVAPADPAAPTEDELAAAISITRYIVSINPTSQGNAIPAPALDSLFDRSAIGTSQGSFSGDFYRDDEVDPDPALAGMGIDLAWNLLPRGTRGYLYVSRFGGTGTDHRPVAGQPVEVWRIGITQRAGSNMTSNTLETFASTGAVLDPPEENAVVAAGTGVPAPPLHLVATPGGTGVVELDWDLPASDGGSAITGYKVYQATTLGGAYTEVTTNITKIGTTAALTSVAAGVKFFKVKATNANGDSAFSDADSCTVS